MSTFVYLIGADIQLQAYHVNDRFESEDASVINEVIMNAGQVLSTYNSH